MTIVPASETFQLVPRFANGGWWYVMDKREHLEVGQIFNAKEFRPSEGCPDLTPAALRDLAQLIERIPPA